MIVNANALNIPLADKSVQCVVTSPPYYGLRDYGTAKWVGGNEECMHNPQRADGGQRKDRSLPLGRGGMFRCICGQCGAIREDNQLGLEPSPEEYITNMMTVFREVWRVLRDDGTLWLNIGDSYATNPGNGRGGERPEGGIPHRSGKNKITSGVKSKDLIGIPWMLAFALRADGWYLRSEVIWHKLNPMPESVRDRPTKAHEQVFLLTKNDKYYYDQDAVREPHAEASLPRALRGVSENNKYTSGAPGSTAHTMSKPRKNRRKEWETQGGAGSGFNGHSGYYDANGRLLVHPAGRNKRTVWTIATQSTKHAHFATFPERLVEPCILAGTSEKGCCPNCRSPLVRITAPASECQVITKEITTEYVADEWKPSCACNAGDPVPCMVFDPFAGSGTVERVAIRLGRCSVGTELNYRYINDIVTKRISNIQVRLIP